MISFPFSTNESRASCGVFSLISAAWISGKNTLLNSEYAAVLFEKLTILSAFALYASKKGKSAFASLTDERTGNVFVDAFTNLRVNLLRRSFDERKSWTT